MKGLIFNEFLKFIENSYSYDLVDKIILSCDLESEGAYTSIGSYNVREFFSLASAFGREIHQSQPEVLKSYGEYLFGVFVKKYPFFFRKKVTTFEFLAEVETHVHVTVKKIYEDSDLPHFQWNTPDDSKLILTYTSTRPLADFAEGLIRGCIKYHKEQIEISREDIQVKKGAKSKFILTKRDMDE